MATQRKAEVEWIGGLIDGEGKIISTTSGLIPELDVTWDARNDETEEKTSPEELLAAAHASCFSMQLAHGLVGSRLGSRGDHGLGERLVRDRDRDHGHRAHRAGRVGRVPDEVLRETAERAKATCPISKALAGVEITLDLPDLPPPEDEEDEAVRATRSRPTTRPKSLIRGAAAAGLRPAVARATNLRAVRARKDRRGARALLPRGAGAALRSCRLQRPPRGGGGRPAR